MLAMYAVGRGSIAGWVIPKTWKIVHAIFPCLAFSTLEKSMGVKHTVLPGGQPPIVAFTVLAQLCGRKANETEMDAALFTKNSKGNNFDFEIIFILKNNPCCAFVMSVRDALVANKVLGRPVHLKMMLKIDLMSRIYVASLSDVELWLSRAFRTGPLIRHFPTRKHRYFSNSLIKNFLICYPHF